MKRKLLSPDALDEALREVAELAAREGVTVAVLGGYAMQFYGSDRLTGDIDVAASSVVQGLPDEGPLGFGGIRTRTSNGVPLDLIVRDDDFTSLYVEALEAAVPADPMPVVQAEHLIAMKMVAGRPKDLDDAERLVEVIDEAKARRIVWEHLGAYAVRDFDQLVRVARWKKETGQ